MRLWAISFSPALPHHDPQTVPEDLGAVVNGVVDDPVLFVDVEGARTVAAQQDSGAAQMFHCVAVDAVVFGVAIETDAAPG